MPTDPPAFQTARDRLLALRRSDGGWSYRPQSPASSVEPSALAALALLATSAATDPPEGRSAPFRAGRWIADHARRPDGSTVVAPTSGTGSGWTTPFSLLLWQALGGFDRERAAAVAWLLATGGKPAEPIPNNPMGHDVTLVGWPWVNDTHSWVEPTAMSLLALAPSVPATQPRMLEGVRVLLDRAIPAGGWNLGNPIVFGRTLRPLPAPTGLALVTLARLARNSAPESVIRPAVTYLQGMVRATFAPASLGWATLGLRAWGVRPDEAAADRLAEATDRAIRRDASAAELALLVLASSVDRALALLGIAAPGESERPR